MILPLFLCLAVASPPAPPGKKFTVEALKEAAPEEVAAKVRAELAESGLRVLNAKGEPHADVWLRKTIATVEPKAELSVKFGQVAEGALLGVIRVHQKLDDFKGNGLSAGVFTLRRGLQPVDGDHQGVSETRDFLILAPAKVDASIEPISTAAAVKLSTEGAEIKHPKVLWLVRAGDDAAKLPRMVEDETLELWTLECEIPDAAKEKKALRLGIVVSGKGVH